MTLTALRGTFPLQVWENEDGPRRCVNTTEGLTHSSDITREGLGVKPTRVIPETKKCARCKEILPASEFRSAPRMATGLHSYCRTCSGIYARERYAADPERVLSVARVGRKRRYTTEVGRRQHLKAMYGLTLEEYAALLDAQGGRCAICGADAPGGKGDWHVDHCHDSTKVRGLLCAGCNVGIGHLRDDPARLRAAALYIESHQERA